MNDTSQEPEFLDPHSYWAYALAQIQRAKLYEAAINGELPSIIDSLVDDENT